MTQKQPKTSLLDLADAGLTRDPDNFYTHDARNKEVIKMSIDEVGFGRSIVIDENGKILAGNGTEEQAEAMEGVKVLIVDADRNTLVAVRRSDLSEFDKSRLALLDNRSSDLHTIEKGAINRVAERHPNQLLLEGAFTPKEQARLLKAQADAQPLAPGGAEMDGSDGSTSITQMPGSNTVMLSLFLTTETHPELVRMVRKLGVMLKTSTTTGTVEAVIRKAYAEWIGEEATAAPAAEETEPQALSISEE